MASNAEDSKQSAKTPSELSKKAQKAVEQIGGALYAEGMRHVHTVEVGNESREQISQKKEKDKEKTR